MVVVSENVKARRIDARYIAYLGLFALIAILLLWQAITYRGLIAVLAEWQFDVLGQYHPSLTLLAVAALICLPLYAARFFRSRAARWRAASSRAATRRAMRFAKALLAIAAAFAIAAFVAFAAIWTLPPTDGVQLSVDVATSTSPSSGPSTLVGEAVYDRVVALDERFWFLGRDMRFLPVVAPGGGGRGSTLRFFVALPRSDGREAVRPDHAWSGTLRSGGLPGELIRLYRYAGYRVEYPYFVLFTQHDMLTWPHRLLTLQFSLAALIFLVSGLLQLAHARRLRRAFARAAGATRPGTSRDPA